MIGQVEEVFASEECLTDGQPDVAKIDPLVFTVGANKAYHGIGDFIADAFSVGKELKKK